MRITRDGILMEDEGAFNRLAIARCEPSRGPRARGFEEIRPLEIDDRMDGLFAQQKVIAGIDGHWRPFDPDDAPALTLIDVIFGSRSDDNELDPPARGGAEFLLGIELHGPAPLRIELADIEDLHRRPEIEIPSRAARAMGTLLIPIALSETLSMMTIIAKTYWGGAPYHFRKKVEAEVEPLLLRAADFRELQGLYWTPRSTPRPKVAVVCMHPRVDFTRHYTFPRLLERGIGCLGANTRNPNNDTDTVHEEIILDVAAAVRFLKEFRGAEKVILIGNSGGGSLNALFQSQATKPAKERIAIAPGGLPTRLTQVDLISADGIVHISAHRGEGAVLMNVIDPSVIDELDPRATDPSLDMYDPRNGFRPPPEWSRYAPEFLECYRAAQVERVKRIDAIAQKKMNAVLEAIAAMEAPGFDERPES